MKNLLAHTFSDAELEKIEQKNCQNCIGAVQVPVGLAGPLPVRIHEWQDGVEVEPSREHTFSLPLATTEGALVPSINRGCKALRLAGVTDVITEYKGMTRAPVFLCQNGVQARRFLHWAMKQGEVFARMSKEVSDHLEFLDMSGWLVGRHVYLRCKFHTDQAMGMNMVTIATSRACDLLAQIVQDDLQGCQATCVALSSNVCTDKKTAQVNQLLGRGWCVQVEAHIPEKIIVEVLKTTSEALVRTHTAKNLIGSHLAGGTPQNMQIANAAAAFLLATGQDAAHVVDLSQGSTTIEEDGEGAFVSVTLPTVPVGSVGGGTWLPQQTAARALLIGGEQPSAMELAAGVGLAALAGELSGMAALSAHHLARAHQQFGRGENPQQVREKRSS